MEWKSCTVREGGYEIKFVKARKNITFVKNKQEINVNANVIKLLVRYLRIFVIS